MNPIATALVSIADSLKRFWFSPDIEEAEKAIKEAKTEGLTSLDDLKKEFGL